ncbi:substrate-binding periplasmic protein [Pseudomonas promysalinigenes]|uniref:substrate-binding periplasmic protein n=1 Tax=Pseudomonas TaxID=286 RepID=UPI0016441AA4|nr:MULTISPECIES: transporter substrate-binding domain-containing protein [Pseudomonas]QXI33436.1 transporter substrate-binding domain-containing protein [Pseudomonas promysalinigenes]
MRYAVRLLCIMLLACLSPLALAERLRLVSDDWAPYVYLEQGQAKGIDYEVTTQVFRRLGVEVDWQFMPWKRCLAMVEQGLTDGVMDIFRVESREAFLVYPEEPMSHVEFVLFQDRNRPHAVTHLGDLAGLSVGISSGYTYGKAFSESSAFKRESAPTHEANFGKLIRARVDLVVTDRLVGRYLRRQLGLEQQVEELPLVISRQAQYLGLTRTPEHQLLAQAFTEELRRFKQERAYTAIIERYTGGSASPSDAVEQHEHSMPR